MIGFCVISMPPSYRRTSTSELYSSYNEMSRAFENTNCQSIGEYSNLIASKYSLNQLTYSVILNGRCNLSNIIIHTRNINANVDQNNENKRDEISVSAPSSATVTQ